MIRKTYNNMVKATKMIFEKGYSWEESNEIAIQIFEQARISKNGMSIEWWIDKLRNKG